MSAGVRALHLVWGLRPNADQDPQYRVVANGLRYALAGRLSSAMSWWRRTSAERLAGEHLRQLVGVRLASSLGGDLGLTSSRAVVWAPQHGASSNIEKRQLPWGLVWWASLRSAALLPPRHPMACAVGFACGLGGGSAVATVFAGLGPVVGPRASLGVLRVLPFGNGRRILVDSMA